MKEHNEENPNYSYDYETTTSFETEQINLEISFEMYNKTVLTPLPHTPNHKVKVLTPLPSTNTNTINLVEPIKFKLKLKFKKNEIKQSNYLIQLINHHKDTEEISEVIREEISEAIRKVIREEISEAIREEISK